MRCKQSRQEKPRLAVRKHPRRAYQQPKESMSMDSASLRCCACALLFAVINIVTCHRKNKRSANHAYKNCLFEVRGNTSIGVALGRETTRGRSISRPGGRTHKLPCDPATKRSLCAIHIALRSCECSFSLPGGPGNNNAVETRATRSTEISR